jgi:trehalose 6-phosphate phosphatase
MKRLLAPQNRPLLAQMAVSRVLLGFDFDGTLAPIVGDRDAAAMRLRTAHLFVRVCRLYPCAVISGRSRADVTSRLAGAAVKYVVGNHGLEPVAAPEIFEREVLIARPALAAALAEHPAIDIEDKRYSLAVHYRRARDKRTARRLIHEAVASLPIPMRIVPGKLVVNVVPAGAPHKGHALLRLQRLERARSAFYVGDDATDEDVFALDEPGRLLTARVGRSKTSAAAFVLRDQREIDVLLETLLTFRSDAANQIGLRRNPLA